MVWKSGRGFGACLNQSDWGYGPREARARSSQDLSPYCRRPLDPAGKGQDRAGKSRTKAPHDVGGTKTHPSGKNPAPQSQLTLSDEKR